MPSISIPKLEPIRNLGLIHARWGKYTHPDVEHKIPITFDCSSKGLPAFKDAPTWTVQTDNCNEYTARTVVGKSEGIDTVELTIETDPIMVYQRLANLYGKGFQSDLELTYLPRQYNGSRYLAPLGEGEADTDLSNYGGTTGNVFPEGMYPPGYSREQYNNEEFTIVVPRCVILGLTPAGGENNSASSTTVKFQAEGGPIENIFFLVKTHFFSAADDTYGMPTNEWDGLSTLVSSGNPDFMFTGNSTN